MAWSQTGFVIFHNGCPSTWKSKLQTEIVLSTTESGIISLSAMLNIMVPLMEITNKMKEKGYGILSTQPRVHCHAFEENSGLIGIGNHPQVLSTN